MPARRLLAAITLLGGLVACGGGGSTSTTPGSPTPPAPNVDACGAISQTASGLTAILNGTNCAGETTSVVSLTMSDESNFNLGSCSGTVIAPRAVLTTAHCLNGGVRRVLVWRGEFPSCFRRVERG